MPEPVVFQPDPDAWALVVGIDKYDDPKIPELVGAVNDACAATDWLCKIGVPRSNILLHLSPVVSRQAEFASTNHRPACSGDIRKSVGKLKDVRKGSRLFIFLSGHGLYDRETKEIFLLQEAGCDHSWPNLGMEEYLKFFQSLPFPRQFIFIDGCLNYSASKGQLSEIVALRPEFGGYLPDPNNLQVTWYAAGEGTRAFEDKTLRRGLFMRRLLEALDPDQPAFLDAVALDFVTGKRSLDLNRLKEPVKERVADDAGCLRPAQSQKPHQFADGRAGENAQYPVYEFPDTNTIQVMVEVDPTSAVNDVSFLKIYYESQPFWEWTLSKDRNTVKAPIVAHLPIGREAVALCGLPQTSPWKLQLGRQTIVGNADQTVTFDLGPASGGGGGGGGGGIGGGGGGRRGGGGGYGAELFIDSRDLAGGVVSPQFPGGDAAIHKHLRGVAGYGDAVGGFAFERQTDRLRFIVSDENLRFGINAVGSLAHRMARNRKQSVRTSLTGNTSIPILPNVRVELSGREGALAGPLEHMKAVSVRPLGSSDDPEVCSLAELRSNGRMTVRDGPAELRIDLPWNSWSQTFLAPAADEVSVRVPSRIGNPPLRVRLFDSIEGPAKQLVILASTQPRGTVRRGLRANRRQRLPTAKRSGGAWLVPATKRNHHVDDVVALAYGSGAFAFPVDHALPMAVQLLSNTVRVEPLSNTPTAEWDLLIAGGRLKAISEDAAEHLASDARAPELLRLAAAYALHAAHSWKRLRTCTDRMMETGLAGLDFEILRALAQRGASKRSHRPIRLTAFERAASVPKLRWGISALLDLLGDGQHLTPNEVRWRDQLEQIAASLSELSGWTAWFERGRSRASTDRKWARL